MTFSQYFWDVFLYCLASSSDELEDRVFFESDAMCGPRSSNAFYEVRHQILTVQTTMDTKELL